MKRAWLLTLAVAACSSPPPPKVKTLVVTQGPATTVAGEVLMPPLEVQVRGADGQVATTAIVPISVELGLHPVGAQLSGTLEHDAVAGVAVFNDLVIGTSGNPYTLFVSSPGFDEDSSLQFAVTSPPPRHLAFSVQPSNTTLGNVVVPNVEVQILDDNFMPITSDQGTNVNLQLLNSDGGMIFNNQGTTMSGVAIFPNLFIEQPGNFLQLRASASGGPASYGTIDSAEFDVSSP